MNVSIDEDIVAGRLAADFRYRPLSRCQPVTCLPANQLWRAADRAYRSKPPHPDSGCP